MTAGEIATLIAGMTALVSVLLTFLSGMRKKDVEQAKRDVEQLKRQQEKCEVELDAAKRLFHDEQSRLNNRVDDLLVALAKKSDK